MGAARLAGGWGGGSLKGRTWRGTQEEQGGGQLHSGHSHSAPKTTSTLAEHPCLAFQRMPGALG